MEDHFPVGWPQQANCVPSSSPIFDEHYLVPSIESLEPDSSSSGNATFLVDGFPNPSWSIPVLESGEYRVASVSNSHSQAEKRRRDRINAQLGTLRKLIPQSDKMDKAALLASVIDHVKDLKTNAAQVSKSLLVPTEVDEVTVDYPQDTICPNNTNNEMGSSNALIRASISCDDRPELFPELIRMLKGLKLSIVRADIASVGGRIKTILLLCNKDNKDVVSLGTVKQSLNVVLSRIASSSMASNYRVRSKRQRFFLPSYQSQLPLGN